MERCYLLLVVLGSFCTIGLPGCENVARNEQTNTAVHNSLQSDTAAAKASKVSIKAGDDTTLQSSGLMDLMVPHWTAAEVLRKIPNAKITKLEPTPNRHMQGQMDTLVTIKSDSTVFQFYRVKGKDMLKSATLNTKGIALANGLEIGMKPDEVAKLLPDLQGKKSLPQSMLIRAEQTPASIRLRFQQNRLAFIRIDGYVD